MAEGAIYASYTRISDPERENGSEVMSQQAGIDEYCEKNGIYIAPHLKFSEAVSGYEGYYKDRKVFKLILEVARRGEFNVLIVYRYDRLARTQHQQAIIIAHLEELGVKVISVMEPYDDSPQGEFMRTISAYIAEKEHNKMVESINRGKRHRVQLHGRLLGTGPGPYGFKYADETRSTYIHNTDTYCIDEDGVEWSEYDVVVYMVNRLLDDGWSLRRIRLSLIEKGIPTRSGKRIWGRTTMHGILSNPVIAGRAMCFRYKTINGNKNNMAPVEEQIVVKVPAIISEERFNLIQQQFERNRQASVLNNTRPESGLLRAGLVKCGLCGKNCRVMHPKRSGKVTPTYTCLDVDQLPGKRHGIAVKVEDLDPEAWKMAEEYIRSPHLLVARVKELEENCSEEEEIERVEKRLNEINKQFNNLVQLALGLTDEDMIKSLMATRTILEEEKQGLRATLLKLKERGGKQKNLNKALNDFIAQCEALRLAIDESDNWSYDCKRKVLVHLGIMAKIYPATSEKRFEITLASPDLVREMVISKYVASL